MSKQEIIGLEVWLDYDSMLNDLAYSWLHWSNHKFDTNYELHHVDNWYWYNNVLPKECFDYFKIAYDINHEFAVKPLHRSQEFFEVVTNMFSAKILTSTFHDDELRRMKNEHIEHHYGTIEVVHEHDKFKYAHPKAVLVDDRDLNIIQWALSGGIAIMYNHNNEYHYNENKIIQHENIHYASNYDEVLNILESLNEVHGCLMK